MKRIYSLLLLFVVATISIAVSAKSVTLQFSNPNAIEKVYIPYGDSEWTTITETITTGDTGYISPVVVLKDGCSITSVKDVTSSSTVDISNWWEGDNYYSINIVYDDNVNDGDVILITTAGGETGGGGGDVPSDVIRFRFTNPSDVDEVYLSYWNGTSLTLTDDYVDISTPGSIAVSFKSGTAPNSITDVTQSIDIPFYDYGGYYFVSAYDAELGDLILIDNGEDSGNGGSGSKEWKYTFKSDYEFYIDAYDNVTGGYDWEKTDWDANSRQGSLLLKDGYGGFVQIQNGSDWTLKGLTDSRGQTISATVSGSNSWVDVQLADYPESETFTVNWGGKYTIECPIDALEILGANGGSVDVAYDNGLYTVNFTDADGGITVSLKSAYANTYSLKSLGGTTVSGNSTTVTVTPSTKSGSNLKAVLGFTLTASGEDGLTVKYGNNTFTYADGKYTYTNGSTAYSYALTATSATESLVVTAIEYNNNTYEAVDGVATIPASDFDISVLDFTIKTEESTVVEPETKTWKFNCEVNVLTFTQPGNDALTTSYNAGVYTLENLQFNPTLMITVKDGYNLNEITVAEGSEVTPLVRVEGNQAMIYTSGNEGNAVFNVSVSENNAITFAFSDTDAIAGAYANNADGAQLTVNNGSVAWDGTNNIYVLFNENYAFESLTDEAGKAITSEMALTYGGDAAAGTAYLLINVESGSMRGIFEKGKTYTVNSKEVVVETEDIINIVVTDQNFVTVKADNETMTLTDNKLAYDRKLYGNVLTFTTQNGATFAADITATGGSLITISGSRWSSTWTLSVADVTKGATVNVVLSVPSTNTYTFSGMEGLSVSLDGNEATYADGTYTIDNVPSTNLGQIIVEVPQALADQYELVGVTPDNGETITPYEGKVYIPLYEFVTSTHFTIETKEKSAAGETVTTSFQVVNGSPYAANVWNVTQNKQIEFENNQPVEVTFNNGDVLFIGKAGNADLYKLVVDGKEVPAELCDAQDDFYQNYGYLLDEECGYYPTDGGSVLIYQEKPAESNYNISFKFENEGTEDFITNMKLGNQYVNLEKEEMLKYIAEGAEVAEGTYFEMFFNTNDYTVNSITLNGEALEIGENSSYVNNAVSSDLEFVFNVSAGAGNKVTVVSTGWDKLVVSDFDGKNYELTGETTVLELMKSVDRIRFTVSEEAAAAKWEIPEGEIKVVPATDVDGYSQGDGIPVTDGMTITVPVTNEDIDEPTPSKAVTIKFDDLSHIRTIFYNSNNVTFPESNELELDYITGQDIVTIAAADNYLISAVEGAVIEGDTELPAASVSFSIADAIGSTVSITTIEAPKVGFTFYGPEGLYVSYNYMTYDYNDGKYFIGDLQSYNSTITIGIESDYSDKLAITDIVDANGTTYEPANGLVTINTGNYYTGTPVSMEFTVNTYDPSESADAIKATFTVVNGSPYTASVWNVTQNKQIEFESNQPVEVTFNNGDVLFIGKAGNADLYKLVVDGKEVPAELCDSQDDFYGNYGYLLDADCGYYPTAGGTVEIYQEAVKENFKLTFKFENEGTEGFIKDFMVGNLYLRDAELTDALTDGIELAEGTQISLTFNTADYTVKTATVNGTAIEGSEYSATISSNLDFVFDVTMSAGNTLTVKSTGWEHIIVTDPDRNTYTLTGAETVLTLASSVERLMFNPAEGYVIPEGGVVATDINGVSTKFNKGDGIFVEGIATIEITVAEENPVGGKTFVFTCEADVLTFNGGTAGTGNPERQEVEVKAVYSDGAYTVSNVPAYLTVTVNEDAQAEYTLQSITSPEGTLMSYNGTSAEFATARFLDNAEFTVNFKKEVAPRYINIEVNNASYISRVYSEGAGNITTFPAKYDLNDGELISIEAKSGCQIDEVAINGTKVDYNYPATTVVVSLAGVEEGSTVAITASSVAAEYTYTLAGAEGIKISYRSIDATYADGVYILDNIQDSNDYPMTVQIEKGYENSLVLVSLTDGKTTWEPAGASGVITVPGSQMPKADTRFVITTRVPAASETVRTVYLTIDEVSIVQHIMYHGMSGYTGFGQDGTVALTIQPSEYEVEVVTNEAITAIETDVEGTFTMPTLPASTIVLNLMNAVEGQTIDLFTEAITLREDPAIVLDTENSMATVTVKYAVSTSLLGQPIDITVNDSANGSFTPTEKSGEFTVEINGLKEGENTFTIKAASARAEDSVEAKATLSGIDAIFMDADGQEVDVYNLQGVKMKPGKLAPGFYIVNGQTVLKK